MKKNTSTFKQDCASFFLIIFFFIASAVLNSSFKLPNMKISKQDSALNLNAEMVDFFSLGYKRMITAIVWVSTILESDHEHYKKKDLNSWMYLRFKLLSKLDPKFYENYIFGGPYLSIIKDDLDGATEIYEKGIDNYPDDINLNLNSGFHHYFELKRPESALQYYRKAANHPDLPPFLLTFISRLIANHEIDAFSSFNAIYFTYKSNEFNEAIGKKLIILLKPKAVQLIETCQKNPSSECKLDAYSEILKRSEDLGI